MKITIDANTFNNLTDVEAGILVKSIIKNSNKLTINLEKRKTNFASTLQPFIDVYGRDMLNDFYKYWVEENKSKTKFRQELEKTWDLNRRLEMWSRNNRTIFNNNKKTNIIDNAINAHQSAMQLIENKYGEPTNQIG